MYFFEQPVSAVNEENIAARYLAQVSYRIALPDMEIFFFNGGCFIDKIAMDILVHQMCQPLYMYADAACGWGQGACYQNSQLFLHGCYMV